MIGAISAAPWKAATLGAAIVALGLGGMLVSEKLKSNHLATENKKLVERIDDPLTGYVVRLAQAHTNVETLKAELDRQNAAIQQQADADAAKLRDTESRLSEALKDRAKIQQQVNRMLATAPQGSTLQERVLDVDARLLENLK